MTGGKPDASDRGQPNSGNRPPSVDRLARSIASSGLPHTLCVEVAREAIDSQQIDIVDQLARIRLRQLLTPVINATGTLLHTNLGRAPVSIRSQATFANVELDLATGARGSRQRTIGDIAATACGAEAALVVNNCASALMLVLAGLASGRGAAVSRGELVEIGGAFRVPDVMKQSGAQLVEVGTTNRTRLSDFASAFRVADIAVVLSVHQSNYKISGFTEQTSVTDLATLGVPVIADIGSGLLDSGCPWLDGPPPAWLAEEPAARQTLEAGADLVLFSGDKLLGGPQAGIIAGRRDLVEQCGRHPLARALRPGGLVIEALQQTLLAYLERDHEAIPFWKMANESQPSVRNRAQAVADSINRTNETGDPAHPMVKVVDTDSVPGGGTLPGRTIASAGIAVARDITEQLRNWDVPIVARVQDGRTICDLRTVDPSQEPDLIDALDAALHP